MKRLPIKTIRNISKTLGLFWDMKAMFMILVIASLILLAIVPLLSSYINGQLINNLVHYISQEDVSINKIVLLFVISLLMGLFLEILYKVVDYFEWNIGYDMNEKVTLLMTEKLAKLDMPMHEDPAFNTLLTKVKDGYDHKVAQYISVVTWLGHDIIQLISATIVIITISPFIIPIVFIALVPEFFIRISGSKARWGIWDAKGEVNKKYWEIKEQLTRERSLKEIRIFGAVSYLLTLMRELLTTFFDEQRQVLKKETARSFGAKVFELILAGGVELWLLTRVLSRALGIGDYTFYIRTIEQFSSASRNLLRNINKLYELDLFMTDFFKIIELKSEITVQSDAMLIERNRIPTIEFKNVSFTYPQADKPVFQDFSIFIDSGEDIAIVGENGAGKTTFVKLLCRFYDIDHGEILIDGVNIKDLDLESWYKQLGVLFQEFNHYAMSAHENILLGQPEIDNVEKVQQAAQKAGIHDYIMSLAKKYDHILSKWFFEGTELSLGQWQRIALARSFYRNPNILILDEPTSSIDPQGEFEIFQKINEVQEEKTTIIISHRFSTVRNADKIHVIDKGRIVESGSHDILMKMKGGLYKKMFEIQAEGYK